MEIEHKNIREMIEDRARTDKDKVFIAYYGQELTFGEFDEQSNRFANALSSLGIKTGDVVYVHLINRPEHMVASLGAIKTGAITGPINVQLKADELVYQMNDSKGKILVTEAGFLPMIREIRPQLTHLEKVIVLGEVSGDDCLSFSDLLEKNSPEPSTVEIEPEDLSFIFYTSGTTGKPKGALLNHRNVLILMAGIKLALARPEDETGSPSPALIFLPMFHVNAMMSLISALNRGMKTALLKKFSVREFGPSVEEHRPEFFSAVPKIYKILIEAQDTVKQNDLSSLKFAACGAAPMPVETIKEFEEVFGIEILEGYGLTEATVASTLHRLGEKKKIGSIGPAMPGQEVAIMDPEGKLLSPNETGEIVIRGPSVMVGYYGKEEATASTLKGGWLHTGDIGYVDDEGFFFIVDREKDMIIKGGENIYPKEIEDVISRHPRVHDVAVIGIPDKISGEEVKAFIVPRIGSEVAKEEIMDICSTELADYKVPKEIEFILGIPVSAVGKTLKRKLRDGEGIFRMEQLADTLDLNVIFQMMAARFNPKKAGKWNAIIRYEIFGTTEGMHTLKITDGTLEVIPGTTPEPPTAIVRMADQVFKMVLEGKIDGITAINSGMMQIEGSEADVAMFGESMG